MQLKIQRFVYKKNFIFLVVFVPLTLIFLFFSPKVYAWETESLMQEWCNWERSYSYLFGADDWDLDVVYNQGPNPPKGEGHAEHFTYCSRFFSYYHTGGWASICMMQVCKKVEGVYVCEGGHSIDDLIQDVKDYRADDDHDPTKWIDVGCFNEDDDGNHGQDVCVNAGGIWWGDTCYQPEARRVRDAMMNWVDILPDECEERGGFPRNIDGRPACYIPQNSVLAIDQRDPSLNCGGVQGEEACVYMEWMNGESEHTVLKKHTFNVANLPYAPSNLNTDRVEPCDEWNNYLVRFIWDYNHEETLNMDSYQLRIRSEDDDFSAASYPDEFTCDGGVICHETSLSVAPGSNVNFNPTGDDAYRWKDWLHGEAPWDGQGSNWGQPFYWTVRVRDSNGFWSYWSDVNTTNPLPPNPYPSVDFDWSPFGVPVGDKLSTPVETEIQIDPFFPSFGGRNRSHVFSAGFPWHKEFGAWTDPELTEVNNNWQLSWSFFRWDDDIIPPGWVQLDNADVELGTYDGSVHKLVVMFEEPGDYKTKLEITEHIGEDPFPVDPNDPTDPPKLMTCDQEWSPIKVIWRLPKYREVAPRI